MVEFPPQKRGSKPQASISPEIWLDRQSKECWWPFHLKSDIAINLAISKRAPVGPGYKKTPYIRIIKNYSESPLLCEILFLFIIGFNFVTSWDVELKDLNLNSNNYLYIVL